jgi:uncharacterized coiled-coil DUF342 family protein
MAEEKSSSGLIQIAIALIGVAGSLGVAWITTGAKFESELKDNQASVSKLQSEIETIKGNLTAKIEEANKQLAEMRILLDSAKSENASMLAHLNEIKAQIETANKTVETAKATNQQLTITTERLRTINPELLKRVPPKD